MVLENARVTVLGLGAMGSAIADRLRDAGNEVTVWNRTPRATSGAAPDVETAVRASELVLVSLTDHAALHAVLDPVAPLLAGRTLVNLSSGTPNEARATARWATSHGARYLAGGVRVPPAALGTESALTYYAGTPEPPEFLRAVTGGEHVGEDPGLAMVLYQLEETLLWTAMLGYLQATALADAHDLPTDALLRSSSRTLASVEELVAFFAPRIASGDHSGDVDRLATGRASIEHVVRTSEDAGLDASLPQAIRALFDRGVAAGHGDDSATRLIDLLR